MKKVVKKITTEEYQNGELVKRTIEETTEEIKSDQVTLQPFPNKIGDSTNPWVRPDQVKWATGTGNDNMVLLCNDK